MIANQGQAQHIREELRALEDWLVRLRQRLPVDVKRLTQAGIRKKIARLREELAAIENGS